MSRSSVAPLRRPGDALVARLALIDAAEFTIDVQYYSWESDAIGYLILNRLIDAADRGVTVRILVDDLRFRRRTSAVAALCRHPNLEVRLYNPWTRRANAAAQGFEFLRRFGRLDQRMHNKLLLADESRAVIGGRNIGDAHFGLARTSDLVDFDVLLTGDEVPELAAVFETYWENRASVGGGSFDDTVTDAVFATTRESLSAELRKRLLQLSPILAEQAVWNERIESLSRPLPENSVTVVSDVPDVSQPAPPVQVIEALRAVVGGAERDIVAVTPFFVPSESDVEWYGRLVQRGVRVRILTNSLASNPGTVSNSGLKKRREGLLRAGVELFELRTDAAAKPDYETPPNVSRYLGLHAKLYVIDQRTLFIGSLNLDPRSKSINTEMGVLINDEDLAGDAAGAILPLTAPENAWRVALAPDGRLQWQSNTMTLHRQPARNTGQRLADFVLGLLPIRNYV